jgi:hypothetical protein
MSEKVKKIMWAVIDCSITKEQAMATLRIKYAWLYPYITPEVYKQHHDLYLSSNGYEEKPEVSSHKLSEATLNHIMLENGITKEQAEDLWEKTLSFNAILMTKYGDNINEIANKLKQYLRNVVAQYKKLN